MLRRWRLYKISKLELRKAILLKISKDAGGTLKREIVIELTDINHKLSNLRRKTNDR